jgi:hypothetical protein
MNACTCGHAPEEHGGDPKHPGSTACQIEGCDCIAYDEEEGDGWEDEQATHGYGDDEFPFGP